MWQARNIPWKAAYGLKWINALVLNGKTMGGTLYNWILKGDHRLKILHITDNTSKDTFKNHATYPKGKSTVFKWAKLEPPNKKIAKWNELKYQKHNNNDVLSYR
jgi:hypothetical protein